MAEAWRPDTATHVLWTMLSVENREQLTTVCRWSKQEYIEPMKILAERTLVER